MIAGPLIINRAGLPPPAPGARKLSIDAGRGASSAFFPLDSTAVLFIFAAAMPLLRFSAAPPLAPLGLPASAPVAAAAAKSCAADATASLEPPPGLSKVERTECVQFFFS